MEVNKIVQDYLGNELKLGDQIVGLSQEWLVSGIVIRITEQRVQILGFSVEDVGKEAELINEMLELMRDNARSSGYTQIYHHCCVKTFSATKGHLNFTPEQQKVIDNFCEWYNQGKKSINKKTTTKKSNIKI